MCAKTSPEEILSTCPEKTTLLPSKGWAVPTRCPATNFGTCHCPFTIGDSTTFESRPIVFATMRSAGRTGTRVEVGSGVAVATATGKVASVDSALAGTTIGATTSVGWGCGVGWGRGTGVQAPGTAGA